jgi:hypothetical protein
MQGFVFIGSIVMRSSVLSVCRLGFQVKQLAFLLKLKEQAASVWLGYKGATEN